MDVSFKKVLTHEHEQIWKKYKIIDILTQMIGFASQGKTLL